MNYHVYNHPAILKPNMDGIKNLLNKERVLPKGILIGRLNQV